MELVPCVGCRRHVDVGGATCPFCDAAVVPPPPRVLRAVPSLTRAAIFYLGATVASACGTGATTDVQRNDPQTDEQIMQPYGAPPDPPDDPPPVEDEVEEGQDPPEDVEEGDVTETEAAAPEEAPPVRRRVRRPEPPPPPSNAPYGAPPIWDELV